MEAKLSPLPPAPPLMPPTPYNVPLAGGLSCASAPVVMEVVVVVVAVVVVEVVVVVVSTLKEGKRAVVLVEGRQRK
jgi:hypothetical protein